MRKINFSNDCYYHIYNRGIDRRKIFMDDGDHRRFITSLNLFNDANPIDIRASLSTKDHPSLRGRKINRKQLVDIGAYCLMPNHFHLMIKAKDAEGVTVFMKKLGTGYAMYFNKRHKRTGRLFENTFKANLIDSDEYLRHLSIYLHSNPLELLDPQWKENGVNNMQEVHNFLENYPWSSHLHYIERHHDDILNVSAFPKYFCDAGEYKIFFEDWILNYNYAKEAKTSFTKDDPS